MQEILTSASILFLGVYGPEVRLTCGWNSFLIKVARNGEREWAARNYGFNFRLVDAEGEPAPDLLYAAE